MFISRNGKLNLGLYSRGEVEQEFPSYYASLALQSVESIDRKGDFVA
jgi:hypothetical protein